MAYEFDEKSVYGSYDNSSITLEELHKLVLNMKVGSIDLEEGAVTNGKIADFAVDYAKIAAASIGEVHIREASINHAAIQMLAVGRAHIQDAAIGTAQIEDASINAAKIGFAEIMNAHLRDASIDNAKIADASIDRAKIIDGEIINAKIANAAIDTAKIQDAAITRAKILDGEITSAKIEDAAITSAKIKEAAIDSAHISEAAIDSAHIQYGAIDRAHIMEAAIGEAQIDDASIKSAHIQDGSIISAKIAEAQINEAHIAIAAVTTAKIADAAIENAKIADAAITTAKIAHGAIETAHLQDAIIGTAQIADLSVTDAKILELTASKITAGTLDTNRVTVQGLDGHLRITGNRLQVFDDQEVPVERVSVGDVENNGSVYGFRVRGEDGTTVLYDETGVYNEGITDGAITNPKISDGEIDSRVIAVDAIMAEHIMADQITARHIAANAITANEIDVSTIQIGRANIIDGSISSAQIAEAAINSAHIDALDASVIKSGYIDTERIKIGAGVSFEEGYDPSEKVGADEVAESLNKGILNNATADNWDTLTEPGHYSVSYPSSGERPPGFPTDAWRNGILEVTRAGGTYVMQKYRMYSSTRTEYTRFGIISATEVSWNTWLQSETTSGAYDTAISVRNQWAYPNTTYIDGGNIYTNTVTANQIAANTITANEIASNAIRARHIDADVITANHIASRTITAYQIAAETITANEIAANTITAEKIAAGQITAEKLAAGAITAEKISGGSFSGETFTGGTFDGGRFISTYDGGSVELYRGYLNTKHLSSNREAIVGFGRLRTIMPESYNRGYALGTYESGNARGEIWSDTTTPGNGVLIAYWSLDTVAGAGPGDPGSSLLRIDRIAKPYYRESGHAPDIKIDDKISVNGDIDLTGDITATTGNARLYSPNGNVTIRAAGSTGNMYFQVNGEARVVAVGTTATYRSMHAGQFYSEDYNNYGTSANVYMGATGQIYRISSARKFKTLVEPVNDDPYKILRLNPKSWYDKKNTERYADLLTLQHEGEEVDFKDVEPIRRIAGLIAEEVIEVGLEQFVDYDLEGEPAGLHYDRLWTLLIPIVRELVEKVKRLESMIQ